ncbi:glycosyl hydrolase [Lasiosphaeria ovina]|uniref:Glycosyl hydrolase n=1 Tax=Lasiosphaeria ovina TaxID=92902 RepID=A0AAE0NIG2_9PEZI|nr:glycosyl hydrolase [Lasiosphaeria ovina]
MPSLRAIGLASLAVIGHAQASQGPQKPSKYTVRKYTNPILPEWNSDPSCTFVKECNKTFFCTSSSFVAYITVYPGHYISIRPVHNVIYASKDLTGWRHISNVLMRAEKVPKLSTIDSKNTGSEGMGVDDPLPRRRLLPDHGVRGVAVGAQDPAITSTTPFAADAWAGPVRVANPSNDIDLDIFWDADDKTYMAMAAGIYVSGINTTTGVSGSASKLWPGSGDRNPEGPHLAVCTVGYADVFQDAAGGWWAIALATRPGSEWAVSPMGRETVLVPMGWEAEKWPALDPVQGRMTAALPSVDKSLKGVGQWQDDGDVNDTALFAVSPRGHADSLRIMPAPSNLTREAGFDPRRDGLVTFEPAAVGEKAGVAVFLTMTQHADLGIVGLVKGSGKKLVTCLRLRVEAAGAVAGFKPLSEVVMALRAA